MSDSNQTRLGFVCVQNAGRSQMATAFANRERDRRGLEDDVTIVTGGTHPATAVHPEVIEVMQEVGIDLSDRTPQQISTQTLESCDVIATMGCSTLELSPDAAVEIRDWALADPHDEDLETVRDIRETVESHVLSLFDELFDEPNTA